MIFCLILVCLFIYLLCSKLDSSEFLNALFLETNSKLKSEKHFDPIYEIDIKLFIAQVFAFEFPACSIKGVNRN